MRFTEGVWYGRENVDIHSAQEVGKLDTSLLSRPYYPSLSPAPPAPGPHPTRSDEEPFIRAVFHTKVAKSRADALNKPTLTAEITAPVEGIIGVEVKHFTSRPGLKEPRVGLFPAGKGDEGEGKAEVAFGEDGKDGRPESIKLQSANRGASARLSLEKGVFSIKFLDPSNKTLTEIKPDHLSWALNKDTSPKDAIRENAVTTISDPYYRAQGSFRQGYMRVGLDLGVGEKVYGLGERFGPFVKNGQVVEISQEDGGTSSSAGYKNIPFYMTNRGYGVYYDHTSHISLEVQSDTMTKVQASTPGESIRFYIIAGSTPKEILTRYTLLTGRAPLPPDWSYGLWMSSSFTTEYNLETMMGMVKGMEDRDIPLSVVHLDCYWMVAHEWCNFVFDPEQFPDPSKFLSTLHSRNLKVCVWINPYIAQESRLFPIGDDKGYFIKRKNGITWQTDDWQAGMAVVDFSNPEAKKWYQEELRGLLRMGVDAFKTDFGERIPTEDVVFHDGSDPRQMHNYYTYLYNKAVWDVIVEERGVDEACLFARSALAGSQTLPVHWGGDCDQEWTGMAETVRGGLSLGLSGFGYFSHDIGGFKAAGKGAATITKKEIAIYKRWVQFGLLSSHSRLHGSDTYRVPWNFDDESSLVLSKFSKLKNRLEPYLTHLSIYDVAEKGWPVMRPLFLEYPEDTVTWLLDSQYMLGDKLLVAPVFDYQEVEYYVPAGTWTNILTGVEVAGPNFMTEKHSMQTLPLLLRPNSVLIIGQEGHLVTNKLGEKGQGFTVIVPASLDSEVTVLTRLRSGQQVVCSVSSSTSADGRSRTIKATLKEGAEGAKWDMLVVGGGVGLDAAGDIAHVAVAADGAREIHISC